MTALFSQPETTDADALKGELVAVVLEGADRHPRSQQRRMGPSELGEPCALRMAYKLLDWPATNAASDPLPSIVGTGAHAQFAGYFETVGQTLPDGRPRYVVEQRVTPRADIPGSCDLYDRARRTALDWKFLGATSLRDFKAHGPSARYRVQVHTYGLGWENAGEPVEHVAIVAVPRGGFLSGMHVWTEPYDRQIALTALARKDNVLNLVDKLDVEANPGNWRHVPRAPSSACRFCPNHLPGSKDLSIGCPGDTA